MKNWIIAALVAVIAIGAGGAIACTSGNPDEEATQSTARPVPTVNEAEVWRTLQRESTPSVLALLFTYSAGNVELSVGTAESAPVIDPDDLLVTVYTTSDDRLSYRNRVPVNGGDWARMHGGYGITRLRALETVSGEILAWEVVYNCTRQEDREQAATRLFHCDRVLP